MPSAPATIGLSLGKAEALALEGNPHIKAAENRADSARKRVLPSLLPGDPMFMVDKAGQSGGPFNFATGTEMWMVEENLGFPGKGIAKADMYGAEAKKMEAMAADERRGIVLKARQAFWDFYYRQKVNSILRDSQARWKTLGEVVQAKALSGQWLSVKDVRLQVETAKAVNDLVTNSRALRVSQFNLNHLFSLPHRTVYALAGEPNLPPFDRKEEDLVRQALERNPEIAVYKRAVEAGDAQRNMEALDHLPDFLVRLSGTRDPSGGGFSDYGFRLGVSLPLFFPAKQTQALDGASEEASAARYDLKGKQDEVVHMVEDAYVNAESAWRILKLYEEGGLLKQIQRAWAAGQTAYRNEEMNLTDFVETYNAYLETLDNFYRAKADYGRALAQLDYEIGGLKGDGHGK